MNQFWDPNTVCKFVDLVTDKVSGSFQWICVGAMVFWEMVDSKCWWLDPSPVVQRKWFQIECIMLCGVHWFRYKSNNITVRAFSDLYFSESEYVYFAGLWWGTTCTPIEKSGFCLTWTVDMLSVFGSKNYGRQRQSIANLLGGFMFASKLSDNQKKPVTTVMNSKATKSFPGYMPRICNWPSPMQRDSIQLSKWDL